MPVREVDTRSPIGFKIVYCLFVVEKFSTLTRHEVFNNEQHNSRNPVHFEHSGIRDRNRS